MTIVDIYRDEKFLIRIECHQYKPYSKHDPSCRLNGTCIITKTPRDRCVGSHIDIAPLLFYKESDYNFETEILGVDKN